MADAKQVAREILSECAAKFVAPWRWDASDPGRIVNQAVENATALLRPHLEPATASTQPELIALNEVLTGCANLLDVIRGEWGDAWSEWDQSIRRGITYQLLRNQGDSIESATAKMLEIYGTSSSSLAPSEGRQAPERNPR